MLEASFCCSLIVIYIGKIANGLERETDVKLLSVCKFLFGVSNYSKRTKSP